MEQCDLLYRKSTVLKSAAYRRQILEHDMHDDEIAHYGANKGPRTDHVEDSKAVEDAKGEQSLSDVWDAREGQV